MLEFKSTLGTSRASNLQSFGIFTTPNTKIIDHPYAAKFKICFMKFAAFEFQVMKTAALINNF